MSISPTQLKALIEQVCKAVIAEADHLSDLDRAIGDGDHGLNMKRGCEAVLADIDNLAAKPLPEALRAIGTHLVMTVGGASGPLFGTLFLTLGKELPATPNEGDLARALAAALSALKMRGKSDIGQKTMLDVWAPVVAVLAAGGDGLPAKVAKTAQDAAEATIPMLATRGRASFLGERSVGHMDPGACSSALIVGKVAAFLGG
ncbi:MAG: dihydroxyacetone kinase subunit DhaL [Dongiaceae bacterium]